MARRVLKTLAIALIVVTPGLLAQTSLQTDPLYLNAGDLHLTFSGRTGMLVSALDSKSGIDLIQAGDDEHGGGWRLLLESPDGRRASAELPNATSFQSRRSFANGRERLTLEWHGLKLSDGSALPDAMVSSGISASPEDSSSLWQFSFHGLSTWSVILMDCLDIRHVGNMGDRVPAQLFMPEGAGRIYRDPGHSLPAATWLYPSHASMQFMAIYGETTGFMITAQDTQGDLKSGAWQTDSKGDSPDAPESHLTFTHLFRSDRRANNSTVPYPVQLSVFHGDWQTAAESYRTFAETAPWVASSTRQATRRPSQFEETFETMTLPASTGLRQREALGELESRAQSQVKASGVPVIVSLGDWTQLRSLSAAWETAPQMGWASLEGTLQQLRRIRIPAATDLSAYCADAGVKPAFGARKFSNGAPCDVGNLVSMLGRNGISIFTLDLWSASHPSLDSPELRRDDTFRIASLRTSLSLMIGSPTRSDSPVLGAKQPVEMLLPQLRFFRTRTCNVTLPGPASSKRAVFEDVPAFDFVYHAYTSIECDTQRNPDANASERLLTVAKAFTAGQRILSSDIGSSDTGNGNSEDFQLFLKNSTLARRDRLQAFLVSGAMLPNAVIEAAAVADSSASAVQSGVWRAKNGDVGIALANVSHEPEPVRVPIDFNRWGLNAGVDHTLRTLSASGPALLAAGIRDSMTVTVAVGAFDVLMIVIHEEAATGGGIEKIINAARADEPCGVAPGEVVDLSGTFGGPERASSADLSQPGPYPLSLDETGVSFDGIRAAVLMASPGLVRAIVPWTVAGRASVSAQVMRHGVSSGLFPVRVQQACPGVYLAVRNQDGSLNSQENPASRGSLISVYATGLGTARVSPQPGAGFDGSGAVQRAIRVTIGGVTAPVRYAGFSEKIFSGVYEIQVPVPASLPPGPASLLVSSGEQQSLELDVIVN